MNAPSVFTPARDASKVQEAGETLRARITNAICRLQDAAERDVPSADRARRIAADLQEALNRPSEQPILNGPFPQYCVAAYIWRDYRHAIDNICAEQGGWRDAPLSSFADILPGSKHPTMGEAA